MTPREFANLMERELVANAHKGDFHDWKPTPLQAAQELLNHAAKLCFVLGGCEGVKITEHAADVGNIAMRIATEFGLPTPIPSPDDSWASGRSVNTRVLAQGMMSAIRFGEQHGTRYQHEMRRLCALIDAAQPKDEEACGNASVGVVANPPKDVTGSAARSAVSTSRRKNSGKTARRSSAVAKPAATAGSNSRKQR